MVFHSFSMDRDSLGVERRLEESRSILCKSRDFEKAWLFIENQPSVSRFPMPPPGGGGYAQVRGEAGKRVPRSPYPSKIN